jgi:hypothetical protein
VTNKADKTTAPKVPTKVPTKGKNRADIACVYFGAERKARIAKVCEELGFDSVSAFVCALVDRAADTPIIELTRDLKPPVRKRPRPSGRPCHVKSLSELLPDFG